MKKIISLIALLLVASISFAQKIGDKIEFAAADLNDTSVTSDIFSKNKVTMLNIWGTFCGPCIREMPDLAKLNKANRAKGVEVVGIPIDITDEKGNVLSEQKGDAEEIIKMTGADYVHVVPNGEMMNGLLRNIQAVPATIFVGKDGKIIDRMYLGARSQKDWQKIIDRLLKNQK